METITRLRVITQLAGTRPSRIFGFAATCAGADACRSFFNRLVRYPAQESWHGLCLVAATCRSASEERPNRYEETKREQFEANAGVYGA
jgi:hypothetical protein